MSEKASRKPVVTEDWAVVFVGFIIILVSLFVFVVPSPSYSWRSLSELQSKVLVPANLLKMFAQLSAVLIAGLLAVIITGKSAQRFLLMFPLVAGLTWLAMIVAGNSSVKGLNLEAVIFSLAFGLAIGNMFNLPKWFRDAMSTELF